MIVFFSAKAQLKNLFIFGDYESHLNLEVTPASMMTFFESILKP